jgi:hypothetical protein
VRVFARINFIAEVWGFACANARRGGFSGSDLLLRLLPVIGKLDYSCACTKKILTGTGIEGHSKEKNMKKSGRLLAALVASLFVTSAFAQSDGPAIDPEAMAALDRMGVYLRSLKAFRIRAAVTTETVLDDGQKIQYDGEVDLLAKSPDRLRIHSNNYRHERLYLFNGKTFTLYGQRMDYYATVEAPATIRELADSLQDKYGLDLPMVDLFRWGTDESDTAAIRGAMNVGPAVIDGTTVQHYAFRQEDVDFQLWIQKGDYPLPRKVVITTKTDEALPQHTSVYRWDLAPSFNDDAFNFNPPEGALRVVLQDDLSTDDANDPEDDQ